MRADSNLQIALVFVTGAVELLNLTPIDVGGEEFGRLNLTDRRTAAGSAGNGRKAAVEPLLEIRFLSFTHG